MTIVAAHRTKAYHLGFGRPVSLSTVARANAGRDYRIFKDFAMLLITSDALEVCFGSSVKRIY
jgi:hypothetical protein